MLKAIKEIEFLIEMLLKRKKKNLWAQMVSLDNLPTFKEEITPVLFNLF